MRNFIKRFIPTHAAIKSNPALHFLGDLLHDPNLFHLNRYSVSVALFWGLFVAMLPIPGQMAVAAVAALYFRCNLPISCALVWITNPITTPFFFYLAYTAGRLCLRMDPIEFASPPEFSFDWVVREVPKLWYPFVLPLVVGSILIGIFFGALGYLAIQLLWRWNVRRSWELRKKLRQKAK